MEVGVGIARHVVINDNVDLLDVDTATEDFSGNQNSVLQVLESIVDLDALLLSQITVHGLGRKGLLVEDLSQFYGVGHSLNKDDDLVKIECVDEIRQLGVLFVLLELHVVLLETMEGQLALVLDKNFSSITHELPAGELNVTGEGGGEHHDLLGVRGIFEDLLDVGPHAHLVEESVTLVEHEHLQVVEIEVLGLDEGEDAAGGADDDVRWVGSLEQLDVVLHGFSTVDNLGAECLHVLGEAEELVFDLVGQFAGVADNQGGAGLQLVLNQVLEHGQHKDGSLSHAGHSLAEHVNSEDSLRDALLLDVGWVLKTAIHDGFLELRLQQHVFERGGVHSDKSCGLGSSVNLLLLGTGLIVFLEFDILVVVNEICFLFNHSIAEKC